jgi:hypothetical protein
MIPWGSLRRSATGLRDSSDCWNQAKRSDFVRLEKLRGVSEERAMDSEHNSKNFEKRADGNISSLTG